MDREQVVATVDVPRNAGIEGFIKLIRSILGIRGVQEILITGAGKVTYKYVGERSKEEFNPETWFESVQPAYILRNSLLIEMPMVHPDSLVTLFLMMRHARLDNVEPIAWATGAGNLLPQWLARGSAIGDAFIHPIDTLLGLPVFKDRMIPDESLTLCAGPIRGADLIETTRSYKIAMVMK